MALGAASPPVNPLEGERAVPVLLNADTVLPPEFATHALPALSSASPTALFSPPPVTFLLVPEAQLKLLPPLASQTTAPFVATNPVPGVMLPASRLATVPLAMLNFTVQQFPKFR